MKKKKFTKGTTLRVTQTHLLAPILGARKYIPIAQLTPMIINGTSCSIASIAIPPYFRVLSR
ncbi:MAG: hypothetical protein KGJ66_00350 [Alphaproteobacteria bacterium]|nr:hypothetical protein [Alphaproteobacteria bacterium]